MRDLMNRMGHDSMRAALIYQHATQRADRKIADALERLLDERAEGTGNGEDDGPDDGVGVLWPARLRARGGHEGSRGTQTTKDAAHGKGL